jgi:hypothetical protein
MKALYEVMTRNVRIERTEEGPLYTGLTVYWEAMQRDEPPVALDEALPDQDDLYANGYIDSLFTLEEAQAITEYASREWPGSETDVKAIILPLSSTNNLAPLGASWNDESVPVETGRFCSYAYFRWSDAQHKYEMLRVLDWESVQRPGLPF